MWLKAKNGDLINLAYVTKINVHQNSDSNFDIEATLCTTAMKSTLGGMDSFSAAEVVVLCTCTNKGRAEYLAQVAIGINYIKDLNRM